MLYKTCLIDWGSLQISILTSDYPPTDLPSLSLSLSLHFFFIIPLNNKMSEFQTRNEGNGTFSITDESQPLQVCTYLLLIRLFILLHVSSLFSFFSIHFRFSSLSLGFHLSLVFVFFLLGLENNEAFIECRRSTIHTINCCFSLISSCLNVKTNLLQSILSYFKLKC